LAVEQEKGDAMAGGCYHGGQVETIELKLEAPFSSSAEHSVTWCMGAAAFGGSYAEASLRCTSAEESSLNLCIVQTR
jgi:hypothetical protein